MKQHTAFTYFVLLVLSIWSGTAFRVDAQPVPAGIPAPVMVSMAATVSITPGTVMVVNGPLQVDGLWYPSPGVFTNNGEVYLRTNPTPGSFTMIEAAQVNGDGKFYVEENWTNNDLSIFNGGAGTVIFDKGCFGCATQVNGDLSEQFITGNNTTVFNNVELAATGSTNRVFMTVNAESGPDGTLNLNNRELATFANEFKVNNVKADAILRDESTIISGFVSSDGGGQLVRATNLQTSYRFPTGSSMIYDGRSNAIRYRPIEVTPQDYNPACYGARLINHDPNTDYLSTSAGTASGVHTNFNLNFYHELTRNCGETAADINIVYDPAGDGGAYKSIAFFDTQKNIWRNSGTVFTDGDQNPFLNNRRMGWAFIRPEDKYFVLYDEEGLVDTIPNIVTMNGDGMNDFFHLRNANILSFSLKIYNRWGAMLFETTSPQIDWDGKTLAGVEVPTGTYFYVLKAQTETDEQISKNGFFSLMR